MVPAEAAVLKGPSMSALGQKRTCAPQKVMSALPPIATAKADFPQTVMSAFTPESGHVRRKQSCLLWAKSDIVTVA
jgi:hypothetical protein